MFSSEFCKISKNTFFTKHLWTTASSVIYFWTLIRIITVQKGKFSIKDFFSKYDQIHKKLRSDLLKKSLMETFIFCVVYLRKGYPVYQRKMVFD